MLRQCKIFFLAISYLIENSIVPILSYDKNIEIVKTKQMPIHLSITGRYNNDTLNVKTHSLMHKRYNLIQI